MNEYIDAAGKTIEDAVAAGLKQLGLERDEVNVEVLEKQRPGFLGIGGQGAKVRLHYTADDTLAAKKFLEGLFERLKLDVSLDIEMKDESSMSIDLKGADMGAIIGRRGDTLDAIQYITSLVVNGAGEKRYYISVDAENYRAKRAESLERCARKVAGQAVKYKRSIALEPMTPNERRIIHSTLQDYPGVSTYSTGSEPHRRVVVAPEGMKRGGHQDAMGGYSDNSAGRTPGGRGSSGSYGGGGRRSSGGHNSHNRSKNGNQIEVVDVI